MSITARIRDDKMWFTEQMGNQIVCTDITGGYVQSFPIPTPHSFPGHITLGGDGHLWFAENVGNKIGRLVAPE